MSCSWAFSYNFLLRRPCLSSTIQV